MLARTDIIAEFSGRYARKDGFSGSLLAIDEDAHDFVAALVEGARGRLDHLAHLVLAIESQGTAGIADGLENDVFGAAFQHAVHVICVVVFHIAPDDGGNVGHVGSCKRLGALVRDGGKRGLGAGP